MLFLAVLFRAFRESKTAARLLQQRQGHCGTSSMVMVWYASCMASSASSRFPLPVSAPSFVSFRFVSLHGCSACSSSSDTQLNCTRSRDEALCLYIYFTMVERVLTYKVSDYYPATITVLFAFSSSFRCCRDRFAPTERNVYLSSSEVQQVN